MNREKIFNNAFNAFILVGMLSAVVVLNVVEAGKEDVNAVMQAVISIGAVAGVINTVLSANGSIWNYLFGLIDVLSTIVVCLVASIGNANPIWGQFALHVMYFLPMQFVGIWQWRKRGATSGRQVRPRRLGGREWLGLSGLYVLLVCAMYFCLSFLTNPEAGAFNRVILMDTIVTSLCILGQVLMALAYADQWFIWIMVNASAIALYAFKAASSEADSYTVIYMYKYVFYLVNSLNGLRIWLKLSRARREEE